MCDPSVTEAAPCRDRGAPDGRHRHRRLRAGGAARDTARGNAGARAGPCCSSPSTPCAPTAWAATATRRRARPGSTPWPPRAPSSSARSRPFPSRCPPTRRCSPASSRRPTASAATAPLPSAPAWPRSPRRSPRRAGAPRRSSAAFPSRAASASIAASATTTTGWGSRRASTTSSRRGARTPWSTPRSRGSPRRPGDVFVWVHLFDPHAPYDPPPAFAGDDPYRGEIAAVDAAVGRLLDAWDARPGPAVVALTADHGEAFGEHGEESHSLFVYDVTLRVPLILKGSGVPAAAAVRAGVASSTSARRCWRWPARRRAFPARACWAPADRATGPCTPRRSRRDSTSAGASCARSAPDATSSSARRGRSCTTSRPIPGEMRDLAAARARGRCPALRRARHRPRRGGRSPDAAAGGSGDRRAPALPRIRAGPRRDAGRARIPRTRSRWRCGSRAPPARSATTRRPPPPTARSPPSIPTCRS